MRRETYNPQTYPSIFNDVIGPVMRGPSSSHCAAALRIGRLARDLMDGRIAEVLIQFEPTGSLATTHESQGSDMGLFGGLLGWDATDERLVEAPRAIREAGIQVKIEIVPFEAWHPNTYRLTLRNDNEQHVVTAISTGGGMIEILEIDGIKVSLAGDLHETLLLLNVDGQEILERLAKSVAAEEIRLCQSQDAALIQIETRAPLDQEALAQIRSQPGVKGVKRLSPVLPVLSGREINVPFLTCEEMLRYNQDRGLELWELAIHYERSRGEMSADEVLRHAREIVGTMQASIAEGLAGADYPDRILGPQARSFQAKLESDGLLQAGMLNQMILYVTAAMEAKSAMGVIVAAPTAGACGVLPGACLGAASAMAAAPEEVARALLAAGMIGLFIAARSTFAAEVSGCQAECGAASGMAAAALVTLADGTLQQAIDAASMALQNILGMICDPVAKRVEVPCLGKNVLAASNALSCANMALAGFDPVIPLDEVIEAMDRVGRSLPVELRCTGLGGLSTTKTAREIEYRLRRRR
jgi:L-serine dehydratase